MGEGCVVKYITFLNPQNQPLYTCYVDKGQLLTNDHPIAMELELNAYQTIDLIELTLSKQSKKESGVSDCFLGSFSCCTPSPLNTFAYVSSTRLRIIVITEKVEVDTAEIKKVNGQDDSHWFLQFMKSLASLYAQTVANPFYDGIKLDTPKFVAKLQSIIDQSEASFRSGLINTEVTK